MSWARANRRARNSSIANCVRRLNAPHVCGPVCSTLMTRRVRIEARAIPFPLRFVRRRYGPLPSTASSDTARPAAGLTTAIAAGNPSPDRMTTPEREKSSSETTRSPRAQRRRRSLGSRTPIVSVRRQALAQVPGWSAPLPARADPARAPVKARPFGATLSSAKRSHPGRAGKPARRSWKGAVRVPGKTGGPVRPSGATLRPRAGAAQATFRPPGGLR